MIVSQVLRGHQRHPGFVTLTYSTLTRMEAELARRAAHDAT